jgi:hypothetical protein
MVSKGLTLELEAAAETTRELAQRVSGGMEVTLYWCVEDDGIHIEVRQSATEEIIGFPVARERALDAFYHPFAHVPVGGDSPLPSLLHQ